MPASELPKQYRPSEHESRIWDSWIAADAFHADPARVLRGEAEPYAIVIPPPNVTARLHLGHALNNTLQDVLTRYHRMQGFEALWMPGTDHAGIATQAVVENRLRNEGVLKGPLRDSMSREEFLRHVHAFKDEYEAAITDQLKKMGCSCDWSRQRFTMDEQCARAVREAFFILFKDGLIYRGKRLVNWDPVLQTAVADDECYEQDLDSFFYYLRYPLVHPSGARTERERARGELPPADAVPVTWAELRARGWNQPEDSEHADDAPAWITVATTRPETYLGDTAVAVNPKDPRAVPLRGLCVELPLVGRVIPIVEDDYVVLPASMWEDADAAKSDPKAQYASGFLKVTPAHDANDHELYLRHKRVIDDHAGREGGGLVNVFAPDATISDKHGWPDVGGARVFLGLPREQARKKVIAEFRDRSVSGEVGGASLLAGTRPYRHSVKHSDRSKAVVEPYLSDQWFVKVTDPRMAGAANEAVRTEGQSSRGPEGQSKTDPSSDESLRFVPERYAKTYQHWHENIRDWCISRQLWWGHRIPVWSKVLDFSDPESWQELDQLSASSDDALAATSGSEVLRLFDASTGAQLEVSFEDLATMRFRGTARAVLCMNGGDSTPWERNGWHRDPDVLDTWFSSALWPMSTMGWPDDTDLLRAFNPTDALCTAREIITLWVSRMVMFNRYLLPRMWPEAEQVTDHARGNGPVPFRDVFIHAVIQDGEGQKMSKSLGNGVDPLDIVDSHGADALRFTLCHMATQTQDVRMPVDLVCPHTGDVFPPKMITAEGGASVPAPVQSNPRDPSKKMVTVYGLVSGKAKATPETPLARNTSSKFDLGRNFCNKLWNASRFALSILDAAPAAGRAGASGGGGALTLADRWMLARLAGALDDIDRALRDYQFAGYATSVYDLLWRDFCDWYLEAIKPTVAANAAQRAVLRATLDAILRVLHPVAPFVTEAIFARLREVSAGGVGGAEVPGLSLAPPRKGASLCTAGWPRADAALRDATAERDFERVRGLVTAVREVRAQQSVPPKRQIVLHAPAASRDWLDTPDARLLVSTLAGLKAIEFAPPAPDAAGSASGAALTFDTHPFALTDLADAANPAAAGAERDRLTKLIADREKSIATLEARLANPGYSQKAPPNMVQQTRDQLAKAIAERDAAASALAKL